jgi:hypothetical protein
MIILLDQYTVNGLYGEYFNSDEPSLHDDARMVVLELGGLESRQSLLVAVMFSLIIYIENRMYQSPRSLKNSTLSMKAGDCWTSKTKRWGPLSRRATGRRAGIPGPISPSPRISWISTPRPHRALHALPGELLVQGHSETVSEGICQV